MNKIKESWKEFKEIVNEFGLINTIKYWLDDSENLLLTGLAFGAIALMILFSLTWE